MSSDLPIVQFDWDRATKRFPRPNVKQAIMVDVTQHFATNIRPEWDKTGLGPQVAQGPFYVMINVEGVSRYVADYHAWRAMHQVLPPLPGLPAIDWVKVTWAHGYHVREDCRVITRIPMPGGHTITESDVEAFAGTLVIVQHNGEIQTVTPEHEGDIYYRPAEADELGLTAMDEAAFRDWVYHQALKNRQHSLRLAAAAA